MRIIAREQSLPSIAPHALLAVQTHRPTQFQKRHGTSDTPPRQDSAAFAADDRPSGGIRHLAPSLSGPRELEGVGLAAHGGPCSLQA
jgi:hypothetical protein